MHKWVLEGHSVLVLNFYTVSEYAPCASVPEGVTKRAGTVSQRAQEDRTALRSVHPEIRMRSVCMLDAPLRLNREVGSVMQLSSATVRRRDVEEIAQNVRQVRRPWLVVAPLGLGGHIDHLTVRQAAFETVSAARLAFYEDLPYAAWNPASARQEQISQVARAELRRSALKNGQWRFVKQSWVAKYRSQVGRQDAKIIAQHARECIWIPTKGPWANVLRRLP
jgi:LmbE family N-acetylglucosaminyl deacetylase